MGRSWWLSWVFAALAVSCGPGPDRLRAIELPYDGNSMTRFVGGSSSTDLWLWRTPKTLLHVEATGTRELTIPTSNTVAVVSAAGPGAVWVFTFGSLNAELLRLHADGTVDDLSAEVATVGGNPVFIAAGARPWFGVAGQVAALERLFHFDGAHFVEVPNVPARLTANAATLGETGLLVAKETLAGVTEYAHWNGSAWVDVPAISATSGAADLARLQAFAPDDAWVLFPPYITTAFSVLPPPGPDGEWWAHDGRFTRWNGSVLTEGDVVMPKPVQGDRTLGRYVYPVTARLSGGRLGFLSLWTSREGDTVAMDLQLTPWDPPGGLGANEHLFRIDSGCAEAATCTGVGGVHRLPDGSFVFERAEKGKFTTSFGGPAVLLVGDLER